MYYLPWSDLFSNYNELFDYSHINPIAAHFIDWFADAFGKNYDDYGNNLFH